jgi:hypothetical protein
MGGVLEGFLRGDQGRIGVKVIRQAEEPGENDVRWVEAVKRKHQWWKRFKAQRKAILDESADGGNKKRVGEEPKKSNSKKRRREKRAAAEKKAAATEAKAMEQLDLNENSTYANALTIQILTFLSSVRISRSAHRNPCRSFETSITRQLRRRPRNTVTIYFG